MYCAKNCFLCSMKYTDHRSDPCKDSVKALMAVKMNTDTCCYDTSVNAPLLRKLKSAARTYNQMHAGAATSSGDSDVIQHL